MIGAAKAAVLVFLAAILEVSVFSDVKILGGVPDLLLVTIVAVALLRGSIAGACLGFFAGLVVDTATLETLDRLLGGALRRDDGP
jgi:rod shape-determining protein MreD